MRQDKPRRDGRHEPRRDRSCARVTPTNPMARTLRLRRLAFVLDQRGMVRDASVRASLAFVRDLLSTTLTM